MSEIADVQVEITKTSQIKIQHYRVSFIIFLSCLTRFPPLITGGFSLNKNIRKMPPSVLKRKMSCFMFLGPLSI